MSKKEDGGNGGFYSALIDMLETSGKSEDSTVKDLTRWLKENVAEATDEQKLAVYKTVRNHNILPPEALFYCIAWTIIMRIAHRRIVSGDLRLADQIIAETFRDCGEQEMADLYVNDRSEFDRLFEAGRRYFHGPLPE